MKVQIEIAAAGTDVWQAVALAEDLADCGHEGSLAEQAEAVADTYAADQSHEGAEIGMQVRTLLLDDDGATVGTSDIHSVFEIPNVGGRPVTGGIVSTAIGTDRLAAVDTWASVRGVTRAEAIRILLSGGLAADPIELHDVDMRVIGVATAEQTEASEVSDDDGWIYIDDAGRPVEVVDERLDENRAGEGEWIPVDATGALRPELRKVCVS